MPLSVIAFQAWYFRVDSCRSVRTWDHKCPIRYLWYSFVCFEVLILSHDNHSNLYIEFYIENYRKRPIFRDFCSGCLEECNQTHDVLLESLPRHPSFIASRFSNHLSTITIHSSNDFSYLPPAFSLEGSVRKYSVRSNGNIVLLLLPPPLSRGILRSMKSISSWETSFRHFESPAFSGSLL